MAPVTIAVPDDFPSVFEGTPAHERCRKVGDTRVFTARGADDEAELIKRIDAARVAINIRAHARFTYRVMEACRKLEMISIWGTGTDNIDLDAAGRHGITVCNTPGINAFAVAEHTLTLMLTVARKITLLDTEMRQGKWPREMLTQLLGKTLGVFGMGTIGARVAALGKAIGMNVMGWSALGDDKRLRAAGVTPASKEDILKAADVISLHVKLIDESRGLLGRRELAWLKPGAIVVNTSRGPVLDSVALVDALRAGHVGAAALDVFDEEPVRPDHPLLQCEQVVLTPHNADETPEGMDYINAGAVDNVIAFLEGQPQNVVG